MRKIVWFCTWAVVAIWSLVAWGAYALLGAGGSLIANNADIIPGEPEAVEWFSWLANLGTGIGEWIIVAIWAVVSLFILAVGFVVTRLARGGQSA